MVAVNNAKAPRTLRERKTEETGRRIVAAARDLFADPGYSATTIEAIAREADVAVETIYSRFKNKAGILNAVLGTAVTGAADAAALMDTPPYRQVAACTDQREQIRQLAHISRQTLQREASTHRILETVGTWEAKDALHEQLLYRVAAQRLAIDLVIANGDLRDALTADTAGATYSALSNPTNFRTMTTTFGWSADQFEQWLADNLTRILLA
ncbi:MAG: TetR/AcrR family transcriptional regulator [Jatrophihabitantaceae bacterium]